MSDGGQIEGGTPGTLGPMPGAGSASGPDGEPKKLPSRGINPIRSVLSHRLLAFSTLVIVSGLAGPPIVYLKGKHVYQTESSIYVSPRFAKNLEQDQELLLESNTQYREFVQQQVRTINRFDIVYAALQKLGDKRFLWQRRDEPDRLAAERLQGAIEVKPVADTYQITIGMEGKKPEGLAEVVNAVVESYISIFKTEELYGSKQRIEALSAERANILEEIQVNTERKTELAQELAVTTFNDSNPNPYDQLFQKVNDSYLQARRMRFEAEAQLATIAGKASGTLHSLAADMAAHDPGISSLKANLNQRRAELLTKRSGLGERHPGRAAIDQEIKEIDSEIDRMTNSLIAGFAKMLLDQKTAEVNKQKQIETDLGKELQEHTLKASQFATAFQEGIAHGKNIDRLRKRLDAIDDRIGFLGLENQAPGFIRVFSLARTPLAPSKAGHTKLAIIFVAAGLFLAILLPTAVDVLDPRLHHVNDLHNLLGFAPAGWIPERQKGSNLIRQDCLMRLASTVLRENTSRGSSTFLLCGVRPGSGTTTIAFELAAEILRLGTQAIVVEGNAFHPDARYDSSPGLIGALTGEASTDAIVIKDAGLPPHIPVGEAGQDRRLPQISQLRPFFQSLRAEYPIILIDAAPLLLSADTEYLIGICDVTMLIVEAEAVTKDDVGRAARNLEKLNPPAVAAVLNRVLGFGAGGDQKTLLHQYETASKPRRSILFSPWLWK